MSAAEAQTPQFPPVCKTSDALERLEEEVGRDFARRLVAALICRPREGSIR